MQIISVSKNVTEFDELLKLDTDLVKEVLVGFLRREAGRFGFEKAVVGVSGGIDSALSCFLAAEAYGPKNVLALRMPYKTSSPDSLIDAQKVIDALGVASETVEITPMVEPLFQMTEGMDRRRKGNVMARTRMIVLYDRSVAWNGLVIGTSNKTELLVGYSTQWGDSASAINPIGDLYKTQVRQMARALGVPESIIAKPPSADLWQGQTDEGELGISYEEADKILYLLFDLRYRREEVAAAGFDGRKVNRLWNMVRRSQYKRSLPIIAKISTRTVGWDFRYPRDWGS